MYRKTLISLTAIFMAATSAINVNAQDITPKKISVGPAIELSDGVTAFGIQGKIPISSNFSLRPIVLFGYQSNVNITGSSSSSGGNKAAYDAAFKSFQQDLLKNYVASQRVCLSNGNC